MTAIKYLFFSIAFVSLLSCDTPEQEEKSPNILLIIADDLGYKDLSCMGSDYYETPNIDKIAQQGVIFTNGYAACQVCSPSRASIMSGRLPARHGITDWIGAPADTNWRKRKRFTKLLPPEYVRNLPHEYTSIAEAFKAGGYATFFAGKWHLGGEGSYPEDHGFDINKGGFEAGGPYTGGFFSPFNNPKMEDYEEEKGISLSMKLANETAQFIEASQDTNFLAVLSFYAVHAPIQTSEDKWNRYRKKIDAQGWDSVGFEMERRLPIRKNQDNPVYAGLIEQMDEGVGKVLQTLERLGLDENTIVVFTSDNGGVASGDNYSTSNQPLRGGKGYQWEGGIRIPFLVSVPWLNQTGQQVNTPVIGTDFYPSFLELAGLPQLPNEHLDGQSFVPLLANESQEERTLIWHYPHYGNQGGDPSSIIRKGKWKLIYYWEDESVELYDLEQDLGEQNNLAAQFSAEVSQLKTTLLEELDHLKANRPKIDPLFQLDSLKRKQAYYKTMLKERLERQRLEMLYPNWQPNKDWWGSQVTVD